MAFTCSYSSNDAELSVYMITHTPCEFSAIHHFHLAFRAPGLFFLPRHCLYHIQMNTLDKLRSQSWLPCNCASLRFQLTWKVHYFLVSLLFWLQLELLFSFEWPFDRCEWWRNGSNATQHGNVGCLRWKTIHISSRRSNCFAMAKHSDELDRNNNHPYVVAACSAPIGHKGRRERDREEQKQRHINSMKRRINDFSCLFVLHMSLIWFLRLLCFQFDC